MEFGKLADISSVDWRLPADDPANRARMGLRPQKLRLHFGAPAWGHKTWIGKIYPEDVKRGEFLRHYAKFFNVVELNTSHYRIPSEEVVNDWLAQVPPGFLFCPKIYQGISHTAHGLLDQRLIAEWLQFLTRLGGKCGPSLLQLPPYFDYAQKSDLFAFLKSWPPVFRLAIEFRHPSWFQNGRILPALSDYLSTRGFGLIITDVAGRRDVLHSSVSDGSALLRFVGNDLDPSDFTRAQSWADRMTAWRDMGLRDLFLFVHEPDDVSVPEMTIYFLKLLADRGFHVEIPRLVPSPQLSLI